MNHLALEALTINFMSGCTVKVTNLNVHGVIKKLHGPTPHEPLTIK